MLHEHFELFLGGGDVGIFPLAASVSRDGRAVVFFGETMVACLVMPAAKLSGAVGDPAL